MKLKMSLLVITAMLLSAIGCDFGKKPEGAFKYYEYGSSTMRAYPYEFYRLEYTEENGPTLSWAKNSSDVTVIRVPEQAVQEVTSLIEKHKLYRLKRSYSPLMDVRDGTMWHVYFRIGEHSTSCEGDNAWPSQKKYEGILAVNACFNQLIESSQEADIIEVKDYRSVK